MTPALAALGLAVPLFANGPVEDTTIDSEKPDTNYGRDTFLVSGPGKAVLIRFPSLAWSDPRLVPETATVSLTVLDQAQPKLKSVKRILLPWGEGGSLGASMLQPKLTAMQGGGATWNSSRAGETKWGSAGAQSPNDVREVTGVTATTENGIVKISGLGPVLAELARDPSHNFGFRLEFETKTAFFSSESPEKGPKLEVTSKPVALPSGPRLTLLALEPGSEGNWEAVVTNAGDAVSAGWSLSLDAPNGAKVEATSQVALAPGDTGRVTAKFPERTAGAVSAVVRNGGTAATELIPDATLMVAADAWPVRFELGPEATSVIEKSLGNEPVGRFLQRVVACVNEGVFPQSRTASHPDGCPLRLRLAVTDGPAVTVKVDSIGPDPLADLVRATVHELSPFSGLWTSPPDSPRWPETGLGRLSDTRDDTAWPSAFRMPAFPYGEPTSDQAPAKPTGLLDRAEVEAFADMKPLGPDARKSFVPTMPNSMILVIQNLVGSPVPNAQVDVYRTKDGKLTTDPLVSGRTSKSGYLYVAPQGGKGPFADLSPDGSNAWLLVRVTSEFNTETAWLSAATVYAETKRCGGEAPLVELRLMLPSGKVNTDTDFVQGKSVTDDKGRFPAVLNALVDGDPKSGVTFDGSAGPAWIEFDLGRDRFVSSIEIETDGPLWDRFTVQTAITGQPATSRTDWFTEPNGRFRTVEKGQKVGERTVVAYSAAPVLCRYLRIVVKSGPAVNLTGVRARPPVMN
ncbi:MAG: hypothetical protein JST30_03075 [Armatimonadetes bacterium]|nr:hypothetical protein [Armatimonadota bacterium]